MSAAPEPKEVRVAWIKVVPQEDATGDLLDQYERLRDSAGNVVESIRETKEIVD